MADKRISQLNALTSPTGSDLLVIVNNNETKKITYADFIASITGSQTNISSLNTFTQSIDNRVDLLESWSSSLDSTFATDLQVSIVSSSVAATIGVISQNTGLLSTSSFNTFTQSIDSRIDSLENTTSSYETKGSGILSGSISYTSLTDIPTGIVSQSTDLSSLNAFTSSQVILNNTFATTGSNSFNGNQTIDGSLTILTPAAGVPNSVSNWNGQGGWNQGYYSNLFTSGGTGTGLTVDVAAGGGGYITISTITINTPGIGYTSGDIITINNENNLPGEFTIGVEQGSGWLFNRSGSLTTPGDVNVSGSIYADNLDGLISSSAQITAFGFVSSSTDLSSLNAFTASYFTDSASVDSRLDGLETFSSSLGNTFATDLEVSIVSSSVAATIGIISQNTGLVTTSSFNSYTASISTASLVTSISNLNSATSSYLTSLSGAISSSSQLTSSYDTRYALSGSGGTIPGGTISGSTQITTLGFATTSSLNTLTASFNSFTASAQSVTTGSNSFNGTQTITGSLIITTGSFVASQILANTASLYLTSGSNLYVQNDGVVEITGSLIVSGSTMFVSAGGDEGGEIQFGIPTTNTTLQNRVTTDVFQNRYRIFEGSADAKGVYIDLSKAPAGVGGELLTKASGLVSRGTDVTLGNLKVRFASTGNMSLQVSTVTGTYSVYGSGIYTQNGSTIGSTIDAASPRAISTTPAYLISGYNFGTAGATDTWVIMDTSNTIAWRITMIIGASYSNNLITIERLH